MRKVVHELGRPQVERDETADEIAARRPSADALAASKGKAVARRRADLEDQGVAVAGRKIRITREDAVQIQAAAAVIRDVNEALRAAGQPEDYSKRVKLASGDWTTLDKSGAAALMTAVNDRIDALDAAQEAHEVAIEALRAAGNRAGLEDHEVEQGWP